MGEKQNISAAQRAANFAKCTRQNMHSMSKQTAQGGGSTLQFILPKNRLLSKILLSFDIKCKMKHESKTDFNGLDKLMPFKLVRRISMNLNNGFEPYVIAGDELAMLNMISRQNAKYILDDVNNNTSNDGYGCWLNKSISAVGAENNIKFNLEMPITLNDRDPVSMIMLQNEQTVVTITIDMANGSEIFPANSGFSCELVETKCDLMTETFSIPANTDAFPDVSVLKITHSRNDSFVGAGQHILKLSTGTIYRRMIMRFMDENGNPLNDDDITSPIELVFNQADVNYSVMPSMLRAINTTYYGYTLPTGIYVFDFAYQGTVNLGGTRDYVDTERLTEFWLRFTSNKTCRVQLVTETISRLV